MVLNLPLFLYKTVSKHLQKTYLHILIIFLFAVISCTKTSTPIEFLNDFQIDEMEYQSDLKQLEQLTWKRFDSIRNTYKTPKGESIEIYIDTVFYSKDDKVVFLSILKQENPYAYNNNEGISYIGNCFIASKKSKSIRILNKLKYSSTSDEVDGFVRVQKSIREIYLREMEFLDGRFNINDDRFWKSKIWENK